MCNLPCFEELLTLCFSLSEQKIDDIAESIDGIKGLLQRLNLSKDDERHETDLVVRSDQSEVSIGHRQPDPERSEAVWDHPAHIIDFVKSVVEDVDSKNLQPEANKVFTSLENVLQILEGQAIAPVMPIQRVALSDHSSSSSMPPLDAVVVVLRWAKGKSNDWNTLR